MGHVTPEASPLGPFPSSSVLQSEQTPSYRVNRLYDALLSCSTPSAYDVLCAALVRDYDWLSRDLQVDAACEKGSLRIDDDVMREAGVIVHR